MKHLKLFLACLLMAVLSIGQVWADDVSITSFSATSGSIDANISYSSAQGDGTTPPAISSSWLRIYKPASGKSEGGYITVTAASGYEISSITFTNANDRASAYKYSIDGGDLSSSTSIAKSGTFTYDATTFSTISFYNSGTDRLSIARIAVTYTSTGGTPTCATPTFNPAAGSYEGTQNVTITSTEGATIYYTTDGSTPTTGSSVYSSAIPVAADMTIKAFAVKSGYDDSDVATAAYEITEGPDVTIAFVGNTNWNIPSGSGNKTVAEGTYTDGTYTIKVAGSTGEGYYINGYLFLGKTGAYVELPEFSNPVEKIVVVGTSGGSTGVKFNIYDGTTAVSTEVTGCKNVSQEFTIENPEANKAYKVQVTSNANLQISAIKIFFGSAPAVAKPTISGDENFVTSTTVTLACSTTGADIYYTTDGTDPKLSATTGTSFSLTETATVRAIAKLGSDWSAEATKTFTKVDALTTMDAIFAAATTAGSTAADAYVTFNNWVVSAVTSNNAFVTDGTKGLIIYANSHGFEVGDILSGTAACKVQLYKGSSEITSLTKTTEGLTVTAGGTAAVNTKTIDQLGAINTGAVVTIENVTYDGTNLSDGANTIKPYNKLFSFTMENGKEYNVTGVIDYYDALQIMPRSAADVEEVTAAGAPEAPTFTPAAGTYTSAQSVTLSCETDGATIYYTTNGDTPDDGSTPYTGAISVNEDMTIKAIAYKAGVPSSVATAAYVINLPLTTMDAIFAKATAVGTTATDVTIVLNNWVVSGIYTNNKDVFVTDGTKGFLIYDNGAAMGFNVGDVLSGTVACKVQLFKGAAEVTTLNSTTTGLTVTPDGSAALNTKTIDQLGAVNTGALVKIENLTYNSTSKKLSDGTNEITPYKGLFESMAFENGKKYNVTGVVGYYDVLQIMPRSAADIDEIVLPDPELSYSPATLTIQQGDAWSAPTLNNPHGVTITSYASNNEAVATVTNEGVIALAGGIGTATITATFAGNGSYNAGTATYTITVNEAGVYSMSIDLTKASYDDAADAEVVWNSNVVTITAQQGTGTKVTNYLAGNYSGTTLIEETRLYENNILTFTPKTGVTITKVEWIATTKAYAESLAKEGTTTAWTNATAALDAEYSTNKKVIITPSASGAFSAVLGKSGSNKGTRGASVVVYYTAESEKAKLAASISIADMNMAVGDADILLSAIEATSNPNKKAISYAVTSGTAVTIEGTGAEAALHAAAEGTATITATIPDNLGNYTGATTTFTVTVAAAATLESIAISGDASVLEYTEGQDFNPAGLVVTGTYSDASTAPISEGITWAYDPSPLTQGTTSVSVTATVSEISSPAFVVNGLTVSAAAPAGDDYIKVTASQTDWSGDYILVYEDGTDAYVWNGDYSDAASNYASATISSNTIAKPAAAAVITIAPASEGKYTLQVNGDKYFQDNGSGSKLIFTDAIEDAAKVTISYETDWTKLMFSERCIRFNSSSGQTRFRFYGESNQQAVQLYKKDAPAPVYETVRTGLTPNHYYTICHPKAMTAIQGATLWSFIGKDASFAYLVQEDAPFEAGKPYIMCATESTVQAVLEGADAAAGSNNGLHGTLSPMDQDALNAAATAAGHDLYFVSGDLLRRATGYALDGITPLTGNSLPAQRAYVIVDEITGPTSAPGKKVRKMPMQGQTTTGCELINAAEAPAKMMINGQLFILRGEKKYDATGRLVK